MLRQLGAVLDDAGVRARRFAISTPPVWKHWGAAVRDAVPAVEPVPIPDGERVKTLAQVAEVYDALFRANADRQSAVLTVGGGVVSDLGGFVAATYLRGLQVAHVPTTLLAQVDAAIGGKVGVNLPGGKNLVGSFYQPWVVVCDPDVLSTLPRREYRAGLYEVIKYGMACRRDVFEQTERDLSLVSRRDPAALGPLIANCVQIKAEVVAADEREAGHREVLNFGHTTAHAIESITRYQRFLHGEAVAYGMMVAADLAVGRGLLGPAQQASLNALIAKLGPLPTVSDVFPITVIDQMRRDKKVRDDRIRFILPTDIGATVTVDDISDDELKRSLQNCGIGG